MSVKENSSIIINDATNLAHVQANDILKCLKIIFPVFSAGVLLQQNSFIFNVPFIRYEATVGETIRRETLDLFKLIPRSLQFYIKDLLNKFAEHGVIK